MSDAKQPPVMLVWAGRLLPFAGLLYGGWPDDTCGPAFFPDGSLDSWTEAVCEGPLAERRGIAILMLILGFVALAIVQVAYWRKPKDDGKP